MLAPWLAPEPLIQSADPGIRTEARQILADDPDAARAAERLTHWVAAHVRKDATVGLPDAARVFAQRRGDCNELTVLYVALARAVGLVFVRGAFYYHAWPEVYLGRWVPVDPLLNQFPADAAHLRFIVGGLARQAQLMRFVGQLKLEGL
jgi:transglutaminase-like putative cysteine protease